MCFVHVCLSTVSYNPTHQTKADQTVRNNTKCTHDALVASCHHLAASWHHLAASASLLAPPDAIWQLLAPSWHLASSGQPLLASAGHLAASGIVLPAFATLWASKIQVWRSAAEAVAYKCAAAGLSPASNGVPDQS